MRNWLGFDSMQYFKAYMGLFLVICMAFPTAPSYAEGCVVLLHGLARNKNSMGSLAKRLEQVGYKVVNQGYKSRKHPIETLSQKPSRPHSKLAARPNLVILSPIRWGAFWCGSMWPTLKTRSNI